MLTLEQLKSILRYDPTTGEFTYLVKRGQCAPGDLSGRIGSGGYWRISVDRKLYQAHRLAWFYVHGEWPARTVDHINLNKLDNRISNLRLATPTENNANTAKGSRNSSGFKGVTWHKGCGKWQAAIKVGGKNHHLGLFETPELAHAAYCGASKVAFGKFARAA